MTISNVLRRGALLLLALSSSVQGDESSFDWGGRVTARLTSLSQIPIETGAKLPHLAYGEVIAGIWAKTKLTPDIETKVHLITDVRNYKDESTRRNAYRFVDEIIVQSLYVKVDRLFSDHFSLTVGRQNLLYGSGNVLFESSPLDGVRGYYFNAVKGSWGFDQFKVDVIGIYNPSEDDFVINDQHKRLVENDESGGVVYLTNKSHPLLPKDLYYVYKHEKTASGPALDLHTVGFRLQPNVSENIKANVELAYQGGDGAGGANISAWMFDAYAKWTFPTVASKPELLLGYYFLSGDDPNSRQDEGWNPVWARWPKYNYIGAYNFLPVIARWSNLGMTRLGVTMATPGNTTLTVTASHLTAPEAGPAGGKTRGELVSVALDFKVAEQIKGWAGYEWFTPGNYYPDQHEGAHWARLEFIYSF